METILLTAEQAGVRLDVFLTEQLEGAVSRSAAQKLLESHLFVRRELVIDESPLTYFEMAGGESRLPLLYAVLSFAQEYVDHQSVHYCFFGNMNYFTP